MSSCQKNERCIRYDLDCDGNVEVCYPAYPPAPADPVNTRLLDAAYQLCLKISSRESVERMLKDEFLALQDAIAAAEQQQAHPLPELSDDQILEVMGKALEKSASKRITGEEIDFAISRAIIAADRELRGSN